MTPRNVMPKERRQLLGKLGLLGACLLVAVLIGCGDSEPQRSQAAFCQTLERHNASMAERTKSAGDGFGAQFALIMANAGEFTDLLEDLDTVAPTELEEDMHDVRTTFNSAIDKATDNTGSSVSGAFMQALSGGIGSVMRILMRGPAYERVDSYAKAQCSLGLFSGPTIDSPGQ